MSLVIAPPPGEHESLMGYVTRLRIANGHPTSHWILGAMGRGEYRSTIGRLNAEGLGTLASLSPADVERLTHHPSTQPKVFIRVYGNDLPSYEVSLSRPKICPVCVAEGRPCEAFWDLAQARACPLHSVALISQCHVCREPLKWSRPKIGRCECGADLGGAKTNEVPPAVRDLMSAFRASLYKDLSPVAVDESLSHLKGLDARRFCKLLWVLSGTIHEAKGGSRQPKDRRHYLSRIGNVADVLTDWPRGFRRFLHERYAESLEESAQLPPFRSVFNWLFVRLIKNDAEDGEAFSFLQREVYGFGAGYWPKGLMARSSQAVELLPSETKWAGFTEAVQITGMHTATLRKRIDSGEIPAKRIRGSGSRGLVVEISALKDRRSSEYVPLSIRYAAPMIGISIDTLRVLRERGIYRTRFHTEYPSSFSFEDVDSLSKRLGSIGHGLSFSRSDGVFPLRVLFRRWMVSPAEKASFIEALLDDPGWVVGKRRGGGFEDLQVREGDALAFVKKLRSTLPACLTQATAATIIGCSVPVVRGLKLHGHLITHRRLGRDMLCESSVESFSQRYLSLSRFCSDLKKTSGAVLASVDMTKVRHVKVECLQYNAFFLDRRDLRKMERMTRKAIAT